MNEYLVYGFKREPKQRRSPGLPNMGFSATLERVVWISQQEEQHIDRHMAFFIHQPGKFLD